MWTLVGLFFFCDGASMAQFCKDRSDGLHKRGGGFQGFLGGSGANFGTGEYLVG